MIELKQRAHAAVHSARKTVAMLIWKKNIVTPDL